MMSKKGLVIYAAIGVAILIAMVAYHYRLSNTPLSLDNGWMF